MRYSPLFKQSLILKAKQKYKGYRNIIPILIDMYSILVETKYTGFSILNYMDIPNYFNTVALDLKKHLDLETQEINLLNNKINTLVGKMSELESIDKTEIVKLHLTPEYIKTVAGLKDLLQKVFDSLGIETKIVKVKSDKTGILVPTFVTDLTPTEQFIEEQISLSSAIKEKIFEKFKESIKKQGLRVDDRGDGFYYLLEKGGFPIGFIHNNIPDPKTTFKIFNNKAEIKTFLEKKQLIDEAYDKLTLGEEGKLYTPNGELVTTIDFIPKQKIQASIKKYNTLIDQHNSTLQSYETKLNNEPKTVQLGDHSLKIVKVIDKNVVRPIIIEGPYTGVFLDQLVSSEGKVLGSKSVASPYFMENKQVLESMGGGRLRVKDIFKMEQSVVSNLVKDYVPRNNPLDTSIHIEYEWEWQGKPSWQKMRDIGKIINEDGDKKIDIKKIPKIIGLNIVVDIDSGTTEIKSYFDLARIKTNIIKKNSEGTQILNLNRSIYFDFMGKPEEIHNDLFTAPECAPDGLGLRVFTQQVKAAVESKFPKITTLAARSDGFFVGYYVWPKMGYGGKIQHLARFFKQTYKSRGSETESFEDIDNFEEDDGYHDPNIYHDIHPKAVPLFKWLDERNLLKKMKRKGSKEYIYEANILDIYAYKVGDRFVGQELWKEFGDVVNLTFDLSEGSLSRRILDSYVTLKAQKDGIPVQDYLNIDYAKYTQKSFTCLINDIIGWYKKGRTSLVSRISNSIKESLKVAIKNKDNGEILEFLNRKEIVQVLEVFQDYNILENEDLVELKNILKENNIRLPPNNFKLASDTNSPNKKPRKNDAVFRGLDMGILDKIWDEISKLYN